MPFGLFGDKVRVMHFDSGGCNGCSLELTAATGPKFDIKRFCQLTQDPKKARILVVIGPVTKKTKDELVKIYESMPKPKIVIALGSCCATKGIYKDCYNILGPLDDIIHADIFVPGCPPKPEMMIEAIIEARKKLD